MDAEKFRRNAANCQQLAEEAKDEVTARRFRRMEAAWLALAEEQDWLDGKTPPDEQQPQLLLQG